MSNFDFPPTNEAQERNPAFDGALGHFSKKFGANKDMMARLDDPYFALVFKKEVEEKLPDFMRKWGYDSVDDGMEAANFSKALMDLMKERYDYTVNELDDPRRANNYE